ncbi:MAG: hypothetical protein AAFX06_14950 [Planctomycetota bacterium]
MSLYSDAFSFHADLLEASASESVEYEDPDGNVLVDVPAVIGRSELETIDSEGAGIALETKDFIIQQSHFGELGDPKRRAIIRQCVNDAIETYQVLPDAGVAHFTVTDGYGTAFRIRTKRLDNI